jgi:predicted metalloprotease
MEWQSGDMSSDIEDRRGDSGGGGGFGFGGGGIGIVGFVILLVLSLVTGHNFLGGMLGGGSSQPQQTQQTQSIGDSGAAAPADGGTNNQVADRDAHLISFTLDDVQKFWTQEFQKEGWPPYRHAKLVLFSGATYSGCGSAQAATGPFYCPEDNKVYIDLTFWNELRQFGGSTADFAQSYVLAHELGHHVQFLLGTEQKVQRLDQQDPADANKVSVSVELQADCYGGVWAHSAQQRGIVDPGDIDAALSAVSAVGDDHLQQMSGRAVSPETWTHGSSAQREQWFKTGFTTGDPKACDTFNGQDAPS